MAESEPPVGRSAVEAAWTRRWTDRVPSAARLGRRAGDSSLIGHLLPAGRRYPTETGDLDRLLGGYRHLFDELTGADPAHRRPILITHGWRSTPDGTPLRDELLATHTPGARYWRTDRLGREPGFVSLIHSFWQPLIRFADAAAAIELFCVDSTHDVIIADAEFQWVLVLRNGGFELLTPDPAIRTRVDRLGTTRNLREPR